MNEMALNYRDSKFHDVLKKWSWGTLLQDFL